MDARNVSRSEIEQLRERLRRYQLYLGVTFASIGLATLVSVGLLAFYGYRLSERILDGEDRFRRVSEETTATMEALSRAVARQQRELDAIRSSATDELSAMREAHRKLADVRDPARELGALREANEALWTQLANQRAELLEKLEERDVEPDVVIAPPPRGRFRLGETRYLEASDEDNGTRGFLEGDERIRLATSGPPAPGELVIELKPDDVALGDDYELSIRVVNESNRALDAESLRLDWSFGEQNTGGDVLLDVTRIAPRDQATVYTVSNRWTSSLERGPASVTATLTLQGGARLANELSW